MTGFLILIGLILISLNVLAIKKQKRSFNGVLGNAIHNTRDYDIRIGELKREFSESILELQSEIMDMRDIMDKNSKLIKSNNSFEEEKIQKTTSYLEEVHDIVDTEKISDENMAHIIIEKVNNNSVKVDKIKKLSSEGLTVDEISEIMHLGKGEVLLIKDLYIR